MRHSPFIDLTGLLLLLSSTSYEVKVLILRLLVRLVLICQVLLFNKLLLTVNILRVFIEIGWQLPLVNIDGVLLHRILLMLDCCDLCGDTILGS